MKDNETYAMAAFRAMQENNESYYAGLFQKPVRVVMYKNLKQISCNLADYTFNIYCFGFALDFYEKKIPFFEVYYLRV